MEVSAVILGKGAPNRCSDGRVTMCAIALTETIGLIRVYPLDVTDGVRVWSRVEMDIERHPRDHREESYRATVRHISGIVSDPVEKRSILDACILGSGSIDPIDYQNKRRRSICVVKPHGVIGAAIEPRESIAEKGEEEFQGWVTTQADMPLKPYITWNSIQGKRHGSHALGQEVYEGLRKNASQPWQVFTNMQIGNIDYDHWLVMGNMRDRMNVWVCVHVHRLKKTAERLIDSNLWIADGKPSGWPYCEQEAENVRCVRGQKLFSFTT